MSFFVIIIMLHHILLFDEVTWLIIWVWTLNQNWLQNIYSRINYFFNIFDIWLILVKVLLVVLNLKTKNMLKQHVFLIINSCFCFRLRWTKERFRIRHDRLQGQPRGLRGTEELRQQVVQQQDSGQVIDWRHQREIVGQPLPSSQSFCEYF